MSTIWANFERNLPFNGVLRHSLPSSGVVRPWTEYHFQGCYGQSHSKHRMWCDIGVASNDNIAKCWCGTDKVGVATVTPAIRHSPPMSAAQHTSSGVVRHSLPSSVWCRTAYSPVSSAALWCGAGILHSMPFRILPRHTAGGGGYDSRAISPWLS